MNPTRSERTISVSACWLSWLPQLFYRHRPDEAERYADAFDSERSLGVYARLKYLACKLELARHQSDQTEIASLTQEIETALEHDDVPLGLRLRLLEELWRSGRREQVVPLLEATSQPPVPEAYPRDDDAGWYRLYRYFRLKAAVGRPAEPEEAIAMGSGDYQRYPVLVARNLVSLASLHGREWATGNVTAGEITSVVSRLLSLVDNASGRGRFDLGGTTEIRKTLHRTAVELARLCGPEAVTALWQLWLSRWEDKRDRFNSQHLLVVLARSGIPASDVCEQLASIEAQALQENLDPDWWVEQGRTWIALDRPGAAAAAVEQVGKTMLGVGFRKDYQLGEWVELANPLIASPNGHELAKWLADALIRLEPLMDSHAPHDAAMKLLTIRAGIDGAQAFELGKSLSDSGVFAVDDVVIALLKARPEEATDGWWCVLGELLVPLGVSPPRGVLPEAAASVGDPDSLTKRLAHVQERNAIEGRPSLRLEWSEALADAARENGVEPEAIGVAKSDLDESPERPIRSGERSSREEAAGKPSAAELVETLAGPAESREAERELIRRIEELAPDELETLREAVAVGDSATAFYAGLAKLRLDQGATIEAQQAAETAIELSRRNDWNRFWAGGPALEALRVLSVTDAGKARPLAFRRFADLARGDHFFLGSFAISIATDMNVFAPFDERKVALEALRHLAAVTRSSADLETMLESDSSATSVDEGFAHVVAWFIGSPYTLAWQSGQRTLMSALSSEAGDRWFLVAAQEPRNRGRLLAVADALSDEWRPDPEILDCIVDWTVDERLDIRAAAREVADAYGRKPREAAQRPLPESLKLEIPNEPEDPDDEMVIGRDDYAQLAAVRESDLRRLAKAADGIDIGALRTRLTMLARDEAPNEPEVGQDQVLGWGAVRPQAFSIRTGLARLCAELFDAGVVDPGEAVVLAELWPPYERALMVQEPMRRPGQIVPLMPYEKRSESYKWPFHDLTSAEQKLTAWIKDWRVLGERSTVSVLARELPSEDRSQALGAATDEEIFDVGLIGDSALEYRDRGRRRPQLDRAISFHGMRLIDSPWDWLALNPGVASRLGLDPDPGDPFAWLLNDEVVVRSLHWRSGYVGWAPYSSEDEVGEGWLVLAKPSVVEMLKVEFPDFVINWRVSASTVEDEGHRESDASGTRSLIGP